MKVWKPFHYLTAIVCLLSTTNYTFASGFRVPEVTSTGTATSNALVANTTELGAIAYNPASMSFHDTAAVQLGITHISYDASVNPEGGTPTDSTGEDSFLVPNVLLFVPGEGTSFALLINSPFGLETRWPDNTFPALGGNDDFDPAISRIKMFNVNPNVSFKIDSTSSFAVGIDFFDVPELAFNTISTEIMGDGTGIGWNIAYQKKLGKFNIGASYHSSVKVDIIGTANKTVPATSSVEFPDLFQAGVYFQATDNFAVEFDIEHVGWSSFDQIQISIPAQATTITSVNNWEDTWVYRLGFIIKVAPSTKLMFGYSYDETPQPDAYFSARIPDADRQLFSAGVSHQFSNKWIMEAAYMYVDVDSRTVNSATPYDGTYESDVSLLSFSLAIPM